MGGVFQILNLVDKNDMSAAHLPKSCVPVVDYGLGGK